MIRLSRTLGATGLAFAALAGALAASAPAQAAGPLVVDVFCESIGNYQVACEATITGGVGPNTIKWYHRGVYYSAYDNRTIVVFGCVKGAPISGSKAVVTDSAGATAEDAGAGLCRAEAP
ncbi:hypothetical protein [Longispora albida]|uniref:hypothetical protein n=1 Tax=Longispora albida TaxID=203523 RepID=UPI00038135DD|nr:hypothetical protein [Longispora albida]